MPFALNSATSFIAVYLFPAVYLYSEQDLTEHKVGGHGLNRAQS